MDSKLTMDFLNKIKPLEDKEYLLSTILFHGAPVLYGKKPSCLISFNCGKRDMYRLWNTYRLEITRLIGLNYFELYREPERELVLFYNPRYLEDTMLRADNMQFLLGLGYDNFKSPLEALEKLRDRFNPATSHEIGIMLGIPCRDVEGFINNSGMNYIMNGYWKVYTRPHRAIRLFREYDDSRRNVIKKILGSCNKNFISHI